MPYRTVKYEGYGNDALKTLLRRLEEIKKRKEEIVNFELVCIG